MSKKPAAGSRLKRFAAISMLLVAACFGLSNESNGAANPDKRVAIVIDDLGNDMAGTEEMMNAPVKLTVAIMPFLPTTKRDAEWAHRVGHDVIVHLPMEPLRGRRKGLGPGAITTDLPDDEIRSRVRKAIDDVPFAVGINNHMGSKATADERVMRVVMEVCKERGLFFLDSKTNWRSIASSVGAELGVTVLQNQIFLDDISSKAHIARQMELVRKQAQERSECVAIGHVGIAGKKTAAVIHQSAPAMKANVRFVGLAEMAGVQMTP